MEILQILPVNVHISVVVHHVKMVIFFFLNRTHLK